MSPAGFPHSDILESQLGCQLLEAYRRLLRPSSAPGAKASTVCPYKLATHLNPTRQQTHPPHGRAGSPQILQMLASTIQFSSNHRTPAHTPTPTPTHEDGMTGRPARRDNRHPATHTEHRLFPQDPTACHDPHPTPTPHVPTSKAGCTSADPNPGPRASCRRSTLSSPTTTNERHEPSLDTPAPTPTADTTPTPQGQQDPERPGHQVLLRKEVIQPHLPVRLPCYDFVPIASPTFDSSLPQGVRPPASGVTDFRDVTGGVYKARERIHRSVADLRLLATPTSRGRVADPDPN
jgi:hypothetical protein